MRLRRLDTTLESGGPLLERRGGRAERLLNPIVWREHLVELLLRRGTVLGGVRDV